MAGELIAVLLPPANAPRPAQQAAVERLATRLRADIALFDPARELIASAGRPLPRPLRRRGRMGSRHGRAGLELATAGRPLVRRARAAAPPCAVRRTAAGAGQHRAGGRGRRLSGGARADAPARTPADRRRDARRRQSRDARQGRGPRRGRAAGRSLQPLRRAHRGTGERASPAAGAMPRTSCARRCRACGSASSCTRRRGTRNTRTRSSATSSSSTRWSTRSCCRAG